MTSKPYIDMIDTSSVVRVLRQCYASAVVLSLSVHLKAPSDIIHAFCEFLMSKVIVEKALKKVNTFHKLMNCVLRSHIPVIQQHINKRLSKQVYSLKSPSRINIYSIHSSFSRLQGTAQACSYCFLFSLNLAIAPRSAISARA